MRKFSADGINFAKIKTQSLEKVTQIISQLLPNGKQNGNEWVALNPRRNDNGFGSFKVNLRTGKWADFATDDRGGDLISLVAFLFNISYRDAARKIRREFLGGLNER